MKQRQSGPELCFLTVLPAVLLLGSSLYLFFTDLFRLQPYLMLCLSGLFALCACLLWGCGLFSRMLHRIVRIGLGACALLLTFWALCYFLSGLLAYHPTVLRILAGFAAIPPLLLPAFLFLTFWGARQPAEAPATCRTFRILLYVGALGCLLSLLSTVLPLCFTLEAGEVVYGPFMTVLFGWFCLGTVGAQVYFLAAPGRKLPLGPALLLFLEIAVFACMIPGLSLLPAMLLPYAAPLLLFLFFTGAEAVGLLQNGRELPGLLQASALPVQLMDLDGTILFGADRALPVASSHKNSILNNRYHVSLSLNPDTQLTAAAIRGGYALSQQDLRDLHSLEQSLDEVSRELEKTNQLLSQESELESQLQEVTRKNAFFALQEAKIQEKTLRTSLLLRCAAATAPEPGFRRSVVTRVNVLVAYVQQLGLLLQQARETERLPIHQLTAALEASAQAATAAGTRCRVYNVAQGIFPADVILALYDLQELLLEDVLAQNLPSMELRLRNEQSGLRLVIAVRGADIAVFPDPAEKIVALAAEAGGSIRITSEEDTVSICMEFGKGGARNA